MNMIKYIVIFLLHVVVSTQAFNIPDNFPPQRLREIDVEVHSIDVGKVKEELTQVCHKLKPILENLLAEVAPSVHAMFVLEYLPVIQSMKDEMVPFKKVVVPKLEKYVKFGFNIAEKLIEKVYKGYTLSNSTHLAVVSISDVINDVYNEVEPLIEMGRYMSASMMSNINYRGKRDVLEVSENALRGEEEDVHFINIQILKQKVTEAYESVKPLLEDLAADISPSVYEKFTVTYLPKLKEIEKDILPIFQAKVYPQIQKYSKFASEVAEKLVDKAYASYKLSNSTHINLVSISDVIDDVYVEMKPILDLAKFLSTRMMMGGSRRYRG